MKRLWHDLWPYLLVLGMFFALVCGRAIVDANRKVVHSRKLHFVKGQDLFYIWAHEYRGHWLIDDRLVIETDQGPIDLSVAENPWLPHEIEEKRAAGILPDPARN